MKGFSIFTRIRGVQGLLTHKVFRNMSWMLLGYGARIVLQAVSYILLARLLAPQGFGVFTAAQALGSFIGPFIELGTYSLIVRDIVAGVPTHRAVGNSMILAFLAMPVGFMVLPVLSIVMIQDVPWHITVTIGFSVILSQALTTVIKATHIAHGLLKRNSILEIFTGLMQLGLVCLLYLIGGGIEEWAWLYLLQNLLLVGISLLMLMKKWGKPSWKLKEVKDRFRLGLHFAIGKAAGNTYTDLDKTMLAKLSSLENTGIYSAANRIISMCFLPLIALLESIYPRFFGDEGKTLESARRLAWRLTPFVTVYAIAGILGIYLTAPYLTMLLGDGYAETNEALKWMSLLLLVKGIQYPFADALSGSGLQPIRSAGQIGALFVNLLTNIWMIPHFGWMGAVWGTLITQSAFLVYLVAVPYMLRLQTAVKQRKENMI